MGLGGVSRRNRNAVSEVMSSESFVGQEHVEVDGFDQRLDAGDVVTLPWNPPAQNGTRCRPLYEDQDARLSILANGSPEGRIRLCRLFRPDSRSHLPTGRAIRFAKRWRND